MNEWLGDIMRTIGLNGLAGLGGLGDFQQMHLRIPKDPLIEKCTYGYPRTLESKNAPTDTLGLIFMKVHILDHPYKPDMHPNPHSNSRRSQP